MKQVISLIFAGIIGGMIALTGVQLLNRESQVPSPQMNFSKQVSNLNVNPKIKTAPFDFTEAASEARQAVVHISAKESEVAAKEKQQEDPLSQFFGDGFFRNPFLGHSPRQGIGSGVIYSEDGYIVTNNHVVEFADDIEVTTFDNKKYQAVKVGTYPQSDLAVLKIEAENLPTLRLADSDEAKVGEWVLAVGNPLDLTSTVTAGIISAKGRDIDIIQDKNGLAIESFIQTDAVVNPGNSGGALVDVQGRLLGINTAIATKTGYFEGYSFAIPVNIVKNIVDEIIATGGYERGFLGINIADLTSDDIKELGIDITQGVIVDNVVDGGAAQFAGVLPKDVIVEANGKKIKSSPELLEILGSERVGDTVTLTINRYGEIKTIPVRLKAE